jgi:hypothetical protein
LPILAGASIILIDDEIGFSLTLPIGAVLGLGSGNFQK